MTEERAIAVTVTLPPGRRFHEPVSPPTAGPDDDATMDLFATPILVIEDEAIIAWLIEETLLEAGFRTVAISATGDQAVAMAARRAPGIIVSDVNLGPGIDGVEAIRAIRAGRAIPAIFVTGFANDTMTARLEREMPGAKLLRKPVDGVELVRCVMRLLAN